MDTTVQTRFQEDRRFATSGAEMVGFYAADNVYRKWTEQWCDEETQEVVDIERTEFLFGKGILFNESNTDSVEFYIQSHEIDGIWVTNQKRLASPNQHGYLTPYKVKAVIGAKKKLFIAQALSIQMAHDIVEDYIELNYDKSFMILSVSEASFGRILNESKWKLVKKEEDGAETADDEPIDLGIETLDENAGIEEIHDECLFDSEDEDVLELTGEESGDDDREEEEAQEDEDKLAPCYYEICIRTEVERFGINEVTGEKYSRGVTSEPVSFLVQAKNADEAKDMALEDCRMNREQNSEILGAVTISASMVSCEKVIEREFIDQYVENYRNERK